MVDRTAWDKRDIYYSETGLVRGGMADFDSRRWDMCVHTDYTDQEYADLRADILEACNQYGPEDFDFDKALPRRIMGASLYGDQDFDDVSNTPWQATLVCYNTAGDLTVIVFGTEMSVEDVVVFTKKHKPVKVVVHKEGRTTTIK